MAIIGIRELNNFVWEMLCVASVNQQWVQDGKKQSGEATENPEEVAEVWKRMWRKAGLSSQTVQCLSFSLLLNLGLELLPKGPLQLRNRQSEGEGAIRL